MCEQSINAPAPLLTLYSAHDLVLLFPTVQSNFVRLVPVHGKAALTTYRTTLTLTCFYQSWALRTCRMRERLLPSPTNLSERGARHFPKADQPSDLDRFISKPNPEGNG